MAYRKHVLLSVVLLAISGILFGCGDSTVAPTSTTEAPLVAPTNVTVSELANGNIMISWDANTQPHLQGYNVYRLDTANFRIGKLNTSVVTETFYVDKSAAREGEYEYRVTAVSTAGTESGSSPVRIVVDDPSTGSKDRRIRM
jgi:fibronectin type 3 domain-containing protein